MSKPRVAVVFDGVLHAGSIDAASPLEISGDSVKGARGWLGRVVEDFEVVVVSPRLQHEGAERAMADWCRREFGDLADDLLIDRGFPEVAVLLAPEAYRFRGSYPSPAELRSFRPFQPDR